MSWFSMLRNKDKGRQNLTKSYDNEKFNIQSWIKSNLTNLFTYLIELWRLCMQLH